jgi:RHS repeat-associated protein
MPDDGMPDTNFLYFYHPDHVGSTGYVTDVDGALYEHVQYFPSGEPWVDQRSNTERLPHLFSGKELDQETGLYYFGARYYDPRVGLWASADPAATEYLDGEVGLGGVYHPVNLAAYVYVGHNPQKYVDPDGRYILTTLRVVGNLVSRGASKVFRYLFSKGASKADDVAKGGKGGAPPKSEAPTAPKSEAPTAPKSEAPTAPNADSATRERTLNDPLPAHPKKPSQANPHAPDPDASGPHTVIGTRTDPKKSPEPYRQGITYDANGKPVGRTDVTNHGRGDHTNPHWHPYDPKIHNPFDPSNPGNFGRAQPMP